MAGRGDVPLAHLGFRCSYRGHREIDAVIAPKDSVKRPLG
jgi:succinate dehydrogenase flavin-adding protein (antitoxin of CptAB toxin-antitoxin module)